MWSFGVPQAPRLQPQLMASSCSVSSKAMANFNVTLLQANEMAVLVVRQMKTFWNVIERFERSSCSKYETLLCPGSFCQIDGSAVHIPICTVSESFVHCLTHVHSTNRNLPFSRKAKPSWVEQCLSEDVVTVAVSDNMTAREGSLL